jgi:hypothetical protein
LPLYVTKLALFRHWVLRSRAKNLPAGAKRRRANHEEQSRAAQSMRDHAHTLSDFLVPTLSSGRFGRYNVARLIEKYGDMKLPELRHVLANCPKAKSFSVHDRCRVVYGKDSRSSTPGTLRE